MLLFLVKTVSENGEWSLAQILTKEKKKTLMTQRRSLNAFIDGNGFVVELAEDWNFLPCSTPAINELSPALLPGRHC